MQEASNKPVKRRRKSEAAGASGGSTKDGKKKGSIRIEHLNYKVCSCSTCCDSLLTSGSEW